MTTLNISTQGTENYAKNRFGRCYQGNGRTECNNETSALTPGTFKVTFDYGTVYGDSLCSSTSGTFGQAGTPNETEGGEYCWCRVTGFIPNNSNTFYGNQNPRFVYRYMPPNNLCQSNCTHDCALYTERSTTVRNALYGN